MAVQSIRDLRESKLISQDKLAEAAGFSYSVLVRVEEGTGRTTEDEINHVRTVLEGMEPGTRKLAGRPFNDPIRQAAVKEAREKGLSISEALKVRSPEPTEAEKEAAAKAAAKAAKAEKARLTREAKKAEQEAAKAAEAKEPDEAGEPDEAEAGVENPADTEARENAVEETALADEGALI